MAFKKQPAGSQRTFMIIARFRPQVKEQVAKKLEQLNAGRRAMKKPDMTLSELVRLAVWTFCKEPDDPRQP